MMSHNEFDKVFSSSDMKIESEDWLFEIIYNKSPVFYYLYLLKTILMIWYIHMVKRCIRKC